MGKVFNALQLQGVLLLWIICAANGAPYSKYGRSCKDIGCLPREVCIMAYESCSFGQQENSNCGRYPTCKKNTDQAATQQNTGTNLSPVPENARPNTDSSPPRESINPNNVFGYPSSHNIYPQMPPYQIPLDTPRLPDNRQAFPASTNHNGGYVPLYQDGLTPPPNVFGPFRNSQFVTTTKEPSLLDQFLYNKSPRNASTMAMPSLNLTFISLIFLLIYTIRHSDNNKPYVPSAPPSNNPSGGWNLPTTTRYTTTTTTTTTPRTTTTTTTTRRPWNTTPKSYYNPATPSYTPGGGGGFFGNRYGDTDFSGGSSITRPTTRFTTKKPAGTFDSLFSGFQNALSGQVGNFIQSALSGGGGGGGGGSSSGFGSFFNTRPEQKSRGSFGLFSENTNANTNTNLNTNLNSRSGSAYPTSGTTYTRYAEIPVNPTPPQYGWKLS